MSLYVQSFYLDVAALDNGLCGVSLPLLMLSISGYFWLCLGQNDSEIGPGIILSWHYLFNRVWTVTLDEYLWSFVGLVWCRVKTEKIKFQHSFPTPLCIGHNNQFFHNSVQLLVQLNFHCTKN